MAPAGDSADRTVDEMKARRTRLRRPATLLVALAMLAILAAPAPVSLAQGAAGTEPALVFEALRALQTHYVDPVDVPRVLNGALDGLRQQLSQAGIVAVLAAVPAGAPEVEARRLFAEQFAAAVAAAGSALTPTQLSYAAIRGMTETFKDSHTGFMTPQQSQERRLRQRGQAGFTGVGIILLPKEEKFYVWAVVPGGPAEAVGVREFDRILKINDVSTAGMQVDQVSGMIRGAPGTPVTLTLQRPGVPEPVVLTITRGPIVVPSIFRAEVLEGGIGYIRLYQFVEGTARDFRAALLRLQGQRMRALVLDLRGNGGGYLHELNGVLNALLPAGLPVYTEMRQGGQTRVQRTSGSPLLPTTVPLYVLIDEGSASAAELLSAAVQENRRGLLVGGKTAGAVEASILVDLSDGSALSITTFRLATGRGVRLEGAGVAPDVEAILTAADLDAGTDRVLTTALRAARQALAQTAR